MEKGFGRAFVILVAASFFLFLAIMFGASYRWDFAKDRWSGKAVVVQSASHSVKKATELKAAGVGPEACNHFWVDIPFDYNDLSAKNDCRRVMSQ